MFPNNGVFAIQENWQDRGALADRGGLSDDAVRHRPADQDLEQQPQREKTGAAAVALNEARLAALSRQINPHFLFNTLNSVASLIRLDPEQARQVVYKLSKILRRLLRQQENLTPLADELSFIDDYLAIEMVRFGDKLRFIREIDPATLDLLVPSMLLQPMVENSIRHGLSSKVEGGTIRVRSRLACGPPAHYRGRRRRRHPGGQARQPVSSRASASATSTSA